MQRNGNKSPPETSVNDSRTMGIKNRSRCLFGRLHEALDNRLLLFITVLGAILVQADTSNGNPLSSRDQPFISRLARQISRQHGQCSYPCKCPPRQPNCKAGVSLRKDGCDCCYICTRQQGDMCDAEAICDENKGLYCDIPKGKNTGFCRAKSAMPCDVDGVVYKDGEQFGNCSTQCTCQNGHHACASLCPWEERPPSSVHCKKPQLVSIGSRCCREWVCTDGQYIPEDFSTSVPPKRDCQFETSAWSACSQTCDMGVSIRLTNENDKCEDTQERRLCFVRPCDHNDTYMENTEDCKATVKVKQATRLNYNECHSTDFFKLKYCSTCKKRKCCGPDKTKTRYIEFMCPDGKVFSERFMWIKNCECYTSRRCPFS